jgi:hypothetical protein
VTVRRKATVRTAGLEEYFGTIQAPEEEQNISNLQCELSLYGKLNEQQDIYQNTLDLVSTRSDILGTFKVRCSQFNVHVAPHRALQETHPRPSPYAIFHNTLVFFF